MDYVKLLQERISKVLVEYEEAKASLKAHIDSIAYIKCKELNSSLKSSYIIDGAVFYPTYSYFLSDEDSFTFSVFMVRKIDVSEVPEEYKSSAEEYNMEIDNIRDGEYGCDFEGRSSYRDAWEYELLRNLRMYGFYHIEDFSFDVTEILDDDLMNRGIKIGDS